MISAASPSGAMGATTPVPDDGTVGLPRGSSMFTVSPSASTCSKRRLLLFGRLTISQATGTRALRFASASALTAGAVVVKDMISGAAGVPMA